MTSYQVISFLILLSVSAAFKQSRSRFLISYIREGYYLDMSTDDNDSAAYKMKKEIRREQESEKRMSTFIYTQIYETTGTGIGARDRRYG